MTLILSRLKRPTTIYVFEPVTDGETYFYLDQNLFQPFLMSNNENTIVSYSSKFNCSDCRNNWIIKNQDLFQRIDFRIKGPRVKCSNNTVCPSFYSKAYKGFNRKRPVFDLVNYLTRPIIDYFVKLI